MDSRLCALTTLAALGIAIGCSSGTRASGEDAGSTAGACTRQPAQLAEANCDAQKLAELWACEAAAAPPSAACSRTVIKDAYCCPGPPPKARATVTSARSGGAGCSGAPFNVGAFLEDPVDNGALADGSQVDGRVLSVACTVKADGDAFTVAAQVASGAGKRRLELAGRLRAPDTAGTLDATFTDETGAADIRKGCAVSYGAADAGPRIAPGRVWATLICAGTPGAVPSSCQITAELRLENCEH